MDTQKNNTLEREKQNTLDNSFKKIGRPRKEDKVDSRTGQINYLIDQSVKLRLTGETYNWLRKESVDGMGPLASKAMEFYAEYHLYRKGFLINLIQLHYEEIKGLVRRIGRALKNPFY